METRIPAHLEVAGLLRQAQSQGGFAAVLRKGEREAGTILVVLTENGRNSRIYERMPQVDGRRTWQCARREEEGKEPEFRDYLERRGRQDSDLWIVELDIANGERLIGISD